jgi:hypothetical protein
MERPDRMWASFSSLCSLLVLLCVPLLPCQCVFWAGFGAPTLMFMQYLVHSNGTVNGSWLAFLSNLSFVNHNASKWLSQTSISTDRPSRAVTMHHRAPACPGPAGAAPPASLSSSDVL